jgi:hypothetical protein
VRSDVPGGIWEFIIESGKKIDACRTRSV